MKLAYVTSNPDKIRDAQNRLSMYDIEIVGIKVAEIIEPQSDDIEVIARSKAAQAFEIVQKPLIVNDSGWYISALNGFPGPYMAYINSCFSPGEFLNLMKDKDDRSILLKEVVVYIDKQGTKVFSYESKGTLLNEIRGEGRPSDRIVSFSTDGRSVAEQQEKGESSTDSSQMWRELAESLSGKSLQN